MDNISPLPKDQRESKRLINFSVKGHTVNGLGVVGLTQSLQLLKVSAVVPEQS